MAEEPDRLSELPDELLQHILHLAPCREAESTAVFSRRWRGLWPPPTGAVKIDIPSGDNLFHDAMLRDAVEALAAAHGPVQRLAIHVGVDCNNYDDVVRDVLSHPASRGVQDVGIRADAGNDDDDDPLSSLYDMDVGEFRFSFGSVTWTALRVLHMTNCHVLTPLPPGSTFPFLEVLRLRRWIATLQLLRAMIVASPQLAALQLEYVYINSDNYSGRRWGLAHSLCCPGVTTLVLLNCLCEPRDVAMELYVPRVQHFKCRGKISLFTLRSPLPLVRRAYLHILDCNLSDVEKCESFWNFLKSFCHTEVLKLKLEWPIDYVAALERRRTKELLICDNQSAQSIMFRIKHLEIDAPYNPESKDVGVVIANLLQRCPALRDLRLKPNTADQHSRRRNRSTSLQREAHLEFHKSIDHFRRRRKRPLVPLCGDDSKFEESDIPGLSDRWFHFSCLQFHLKRLGLQFHMDKDNPNCIGVRQAKFFVERGLALEEMYTLTTGI